MSLLLLSLACTTDTADTGDGAVADYRLTLQPVVPLDVNPFDGVDRIDLVLDSGVGEPLRVTLDAPASGDSALAERLPALEGVRVVVEGYADGELVAWGRSAPVTVTEGEVAVNVFVTRPDAVVRLGGLPETAAQGQGLALGAGRVLYVGGASMKNGRYKGLDTLSILDLEAPEAELTFAPVGTMPAYVDTNGDEETARWGFSMTRLTAGDAGKYLLVGGGTSDGYSDASVLTADARLFDPETLTFEDSLPDKDTLYTARTRHAAILNQDGAVVVWGGFGGADDRHFVALPDGEIYDPSARAFTKIEAISSGSEYVSGSVGVALADLGSDGTLVAGGIRTVDGETATEWTPTDVSLRVSLRGDTTEVSGFGAVAAHAMVTLPDGDVLSFGGVSTAGQVGFDGTAPATDKVYKYDRGAASWSQIGRMELARAGHRAVLLDEDHILIAGGASSWGPLEFEDGALSCVELWDIPNETATMVGSCDESDDAAGLPGRAQEPALFHDPDWGVLVAGGFDGSNGVVGTAGLYTPAPD